MLLFLNLIPFRLPGGFPKLYFDMKFWNFTKFTKKYKIFKPKWSFGKPPGSLLGFRFGKRNISAFTGRKNYISILSRKKFRFCNVSSIKVSIPTDFHMYYICRFQHFLKEGQNFKLKYNFGKPSGALLRFRSEKNNITTFTGKKHLRISIWKI